MVASARAAGPVVVVDAGGSLMRTAMVAEPSPDQARIKAEIVAESFAAAGIDALALSASDWSLGRDTVDRLASTWKLPVLAANLTCGDERPYPGHVVIDRDGRRIGVVGFTAGTPTGCRVADPVEVAPAEIASMGPVDVVIALLPLARHDLTRWGEAGIAADVLVDGGQGVERDPPEMLGSAVVLGPGRRGQKMGVASLRWVPGATGWSVGGEGGHNVLDSKLVELGTDIPDDPTVAAIVTKGKARIGGAEVAAPQGDGVAVGPTEPSPFAGADKCSGCHPTQYAQWAATPHAAAWTALEADGRALDAECAPCHATGYGAPGGPSRPALVGDLAAVQCEACHAAGAAHVLDPTVATLVRTPPVTTCTTCHDGVRDDGRFDAATYVPKVSH